MKHKQRKQKNNVVLKAEIQVKDMLIGELLRVVTKHNIVLSPDIIKIINELYQGRVIK
jgi:hypothetical protein